LPDGGARWKDVREFLDDMPLQHCTVKPPHEFCTICLRINYGVANDCPLFQQPYEGGQVATAPDARAPAQPAAPRGPREPLIDHLSREDVGHALRDDDFPIIEFSLSRKSEPKRRTAAKAAPTGARTEDEEPMEVSPLEVEPMGAAPAGPSSAPAPTKGATAAEPSGPAAPPSTGEGGAASDAGDAPAEKEGEVRQKVDPEELMHRIMEELEIPEDDEEASAPGDAEEGGVAKAPAGERGGEGARAAVGAEGGKPRVVEKRIVLRKRKKGEE